MKLVEVNLRKAIETLDAISKTSSRNAKIDILKNAKSKELEYLLVWAFDPYKTFGVNDFEVETGSNNPILPYFSGLARTAELLINRKVTGNKARELLKNTLSSQDSFVTDWLKSIFQKDLRIGIDRKTVNKVFPGLIPEFNLQLCEKIGDDQDVSGWIVEPKLDGIRCVIIFEDHKFTTFSRNGKPLYNLDSIAQEIAPFVCNGVVDGEIFSRDWNDTASVFRSSKTSKVAKEGKFCVFDFLTIEEWNNHSSSTSLTDRKTMLAKIPKTPHTWYVPSYVAKTTEEAWEYAKKFLDDGFEGAVAKNPSSVYTFDRDTNWVKLKFEDSLDLEVIDAEVGTGKNAGRLGAFICKLEDKTVKCGGGFSDELRDEFWKKRKEMIGKIIEVKFQEKTKDGSLRFPVFVRLREDKG